MYQGHRLTKDIEELKENSGSGEWENRFIQFPAASGGRMYEQTAQ